MENVFVLFDDIDSECHERNHKDWLACKSISWELSRTVDMEDLGTIQRGYANSQFGKVSLTSELALHSTKLMLAVADGTPRKEVTIELCRAGDASGKGMEPYLIFKLFDCIVDKYEVSGGEEQVPEENFDLAYRKISIDYKQADPLTNALSQAGNFSWDVMAGEMG